MRNLWRSVLVTLLFSLAIYTVLLVRFHSGKPQIKRNMAQELNALLPDVPEDQRGLADLKRGIALLEPVPESLSRKWPEYRPGDEEWSQVKEYVAAMGPGLEAVRAAARKPVLGLRLSDEIDPTWNIGAEARARVTPRAASENPFALDITLPHLGPLRHCSRLLGAEARIAAERGDSATVVNNVGACLRLAEFAREHTLTINDMVAISIVASTSTLVIDMVSSRPGLLDDNQLAIVAASLSSFAGGGAIPVRAHEERSLIDDCIQRTYTDDGSGDGRLCAEAISIFANLFGGAPRVPEWHEYWTTPVAALRAPGRKEFGKQWDQIMRYAQADAHTPRWQREEWTAELEVDRIQAGGNRMMLFLTSLAPAFTKTTLVTEETNLTRDAAVTAVAVERWRLRYGEYPERLAQLVPEFFAVVPVDLCDGKPLKYLLVEGRPRLYSVGCDGVDQGGVPVEGKRAFARALLWRPASRRDSCPEGDAVFWPRTIETIEEE